MNDKQETETNIVNGKFSKDGIEIGDRRALALFEWSCENPNHTPAEAKAEMKRLKQIMPAPEDNSIPKARDEG